MRKPLLALVAVVLSLNVTGCVTPEKEKDKPVPPQSSSSKMPWNRPQPGEGQAQFGGMLQRR